MQHVTLSGGRIAYVQHGRGFPLLLLHGWGGSARYWQRTLEYFAGCRHVYALDLPGYGNSPPWTVPPGVEATAALIAEFAAALGIDRFDLVGHSFTTSIATFVAARQPQQVRKLVLTCASTYRSVYERWIVSQIHRILGVWIALRRPWMAHVRWFYRAVAGRFFYRLPADDSIVQACMADFLQMHGPTAMKHAADVTRVEYHAALRKVAAPTLVIGARQDNIMPTAGTPYVAGLLPDSRLAWIERCGHLPMIERPDVYHNLLQGFLNTYDNSRVSAIAS